MAPMPYTEIRCSRCGSADNAGREASTHWNVAAQQFEIGGIYDDGWCCECGDVRLEEFEITDPAEIAQIDADRAKLRAVAEAPAMAEALREAVDLLAELRVYETGDAADGELHERMLDILARIDGKA